MAALPTRTFLVLGGLLIGVVAWNQAATAAPATPGEQAIAVLNFDAGGEVEERWAWLSKGMADLTIGDLTGKGLRVITREQMQSALRELELEQQFRNPEAVARVLKVDRSVHGVFVVEGERIVLTATISDCARGEQLHLARVEGRAEEVLSLQKILSAELADVLLGRQPGTIDPDDLPRWTESLTASELLYRGVDFFDRGAYLEAWVDFRRALRVDGNYADALYWSGRMMYYIQEFHQAKVDLNDFLLRFPDHPRAGDAAIEIINSVQLVAQDADEILSVLKTASRAAPRAVVANQFGAGQHSSVCVFSASMAAQLLVHRNRTGAAFDWFDEAIRHHRSDESLYWIAWNAMFDLRVAHLERTGQLRDIPPPVDFPSSLDERHELLGGVGVPWNPRDVRALRTFHAVVPDRSTIEVELDEPFTPVVQDSSNSRSPHKSIDSSTPTAYLYAPAPEQLVAVDVEVRYRADPKIPIALRMHAPLGYPSNHSVDLDESGVARCTFKKIGPKQVFPLKLVMVTRRKLPVDAPDETTAAILSWKATARMTKATPKVNTSQRTGTLRIRTANAFPVRVVFQPRQSGKIFASGAHGTIVHRQATRAPIDTSFEGEHTIEDVPAGQHSVLVEPLVNGAMEGRRVRFEIDADETVTIEVGPEKKRIHRGEKVRSWHERRISTEPDILLMGSHLGDKTGMRYGEVNHMQDQSGRWIVVWNSRRDIYLITSPDGVSWSPTRRLSPPVSSAHIERLPVLTQEPSGRYVLAFASDRNLMRTESLYVCWSNDLIRWSAPVRISNEAAEPKRILFDDEGTCLLYCRELDYTPPAEGPSRRLTTSYARWAVHASSDLLNWSPATPICKLRPRPGNAPEANPFDVARYKDQFIALINRRGAVTQFECRDGIHFERSEVQPSQYHSVPARRTGQSRGGRILINNMNNKWPGSTVCLTEYGGRLFAVTSSSLNGYTLFEMKEPSEWTARSRVDGRHFSGTGDFHVKDDQLMLFGLIRKQGYGWTRMLAESFRYRSSVRLFRHAIRTPQFKSKVLVRAKVKRRTEKSR